MARIAGVDGGGTRTRVAIADRDGRVLGLGEGGPGNPKDVGYEGLGASVRVALDAAWRAAGEAPRPLDAIFLGLAGVGRAEERAEVRALVRHMELLSVDAAAVPATETHPVRAALDARVGVDHDLAIALAGGLDGRPGIALVAGTGSAAFGRDADGRDAFAGGWGPFLDDVGSAYVLARDALNACVRAHDGRAAEPSFLRPMIAALEVERWHEIPARIASGEWSRARIAALAPRVVEAAEGEDEIAVALVRRAADALAELVAAVARRLDLDAPQIALCGGLVERDGPVRARLLDVLSRELPGARPQAPARPPVEGAVRLARALAP